jgi:hypothetical protein
VAQRTPRRAARVAGGPEARRASGRRLQFLFVKRSPGLSRRLERADARPAHPWLAAALLMVGVVVLLVAVAAVATFGIG